MHTIFTDSFFSSLSKLKKHERWYFKLYFFFRYNIWHFFSNLWYFRKELWGFRDWDYRYNLSILKRSLEKTSKSIEKYSQEIEESKNKKILQMKRAIEILNNFENDSFIFLAEKELGELKETNFDFELIENTKTFRMVDNLEKVDQDHNLKIYKRSDEIKEEQWKELWDIIKGSQDYSKFDQTIDFNEQFNGTGIRCWWH